MPLLQTELNHVVDEWNDHHISPSRMAACPNRRPNVLYYLCEEEGVGLYLFLSSIHFNKKKTYVNLLCSTGL